MATVKYSTQCLFGNEIAEAFGNIARGKATIKRALDAASALANAGGQDFTRLVGGDFGAETGNGQTLFDGLNGAFMALDTSQMNAALNSMDKGA